LGDQAEDIPVAEKDDSGVFIAGKKKGGQLFHKGDNFFRADADRVR
jgi:hypothetical protein